MAYDRVVLIPSQEEHEHELEEEKASKHKHQTQAQQIAEEEEDATTSGSASGSDDDLPKKSVRWSTVTVYEFGVAIGGSAIPRRGGPSIGLARKPKSIWSATVDDVEYESLSDEDEDDEAWLAKLPLDHEAEKKEDRRLRTPVARRRRVRWLKPLERVELLTKAGCSEKRIYRMLMETSEIAMSRRLCASVQRDIPV